MKKIVKPTAIILSLLVIGFTILKLTSNSDFKVAEWNFHSDKPIIFYISGDSGFNTFSKGMGDNLHALGYDVFALDTKSYFWEYKNPKKASHDIENYIKKQLKGRKNQQVIIVGFSFGSEVAPFIYNRFSSDLKSKVQKVFIIGPTTTNNFRIQYINDDEADSQNLLVIPEINKMGNVPVMVVLSDDEFTAFPYKQITLGTNYQMQHIAGDHHYGGNTKMLADFIIENIR
ncbi:AcvB/VirJ family lysyl-phosphatidylglycerol hydrolase [Epilithonimonas sp.]|uniref:AcvB/VirJ family lysyl-phosphatidylglycerol hydrolase n=1 Tax=Epilithonimonas sp. TaxID=2894511 RepID=UPI00289C7A55|nr:AcvB/VirJ family lysyl-phosphatidylglycerol hydrolase [Epilithonimonas sp.]